MAPQEKEKMAFVTPDGCFQFRKMPFGMANSTVTFNRMMRKLLDNLQNADSFVDDLLSHMQTWENTCRCLEKCLVALAKLILHSDLPSVNSTTLISSLLDTL